MPTEIDWDAVTPAEPDQPQAQSNGGADAGIDWDAVKPYNPDTSEGQRERLKFNLQNDYQPDQGNFYDQSILGLGEGFAGLKRPLAGILGFAGATDTARRLSESARQTHADYEDMGDALGTSPAAQMTRAGGEFAANIAPMVIAGRLGGNAAMSAVGGAQSLGSIQDEATQAYIANGDDPEEAARKARVPAALGGLISGAIFHYVPGGLAALSQKITAGTIAPQAAKQLVETAAKSALAGYPVGFVDQFARDVAAKFSYNPEKPWGEILADAHAAGSGMVAAHVGIAALKGAGDLATRGAQAGIRRAGQFAENDPLISTAFDRARRTWEDILTGDREGVPAAEPEPPPRPGTPEFAEWITRQNADEANAPTLGQRPLEAGDKGRVSLGKKILTAAGYEPEFAQQVSETFASMYDPAASFDGEAYRQALLSVLDWNGARPETSVGKNSERRAAQAEHNAAVLEHFKFMARKSPRQSPPATPGSGESPAAAAPPEPPRAQPEARTAPMPQAEPFRQQAYGVPEVSGLGRATGPVAPVTPAVRSAPQLPAPNRFVAPAEMVAPAVAESATVQPPPVVAEKAASETPEAEYDRALADFKKVSREFAVIQKKYRAKEIGDKEFLAGKKAFDRGMAESDKAETKYIEAKNAEVEPVVAPAAEPELLSVDEPAAPGPQFAAFAKPVGKGKDMIPAGTVVTITGRTNNGGYNFEFLDGRKGAIGEEFMRMAKPTEVSKAMKAAKKKAKADPVVTPTVDETAPGSKRLTPMMEQYQRIKAGLPADTLLMFRLGDFYEFFFEDAKQAASILKIAMTKRGDVAMAGIPYHAKDSYIHKILKAGKKIAIVDQVGEIKDGKPVKREVVETIHPPAATTVTEEPPTAPAPAPAAPPPAPPKPPKKTAAPAATGTGEQLPLKGQKEFLLEALDEAIKEAPTAAAPSSAADDYRKIKEYKGPGADLDRMILEFAPKYGVTLLEPPKGKKDYATDIRDRAHRNVEAVMDAIRTASFSPDRTVTIAVPDDGTFTVVRERRTLSRFRERVKKNFPTSLRGTSEPAQARTTATAAGVVPKADKVALKEKIKVAAEFTSSDETRLVVNYVYEGPKDIVGTDGRIMLVIANPGGPKKAVLHGFGETIPDETARKKTVYKNGVSSEETITLTYPRYSQVIPVDFKDSIKGVDTAELLTNLAKVKSTWSKNDRADAAGAPSAVIYKNPDGSLGFKAKSAGETFENKRGGSDSYGESEYESNVQEGAQGIGNYNVDYLTHGVKALRALGNANIRFDFIDDLSPLVLQGKAAKVILMPMRMSSLESSATAPMEAVKESAGLNETQQAAADYALEVLRKSGLDPARVDLAISDTLGEGVAGAMSGGLVRFAANASPETIIEELMHIVVHGVPEEMRAEAEAERKAAAQAAGAPAPVVAGDLSSGQFALLGIDLKWYELSNVDEYVTQHFAKKAAGELAAGKAGLWTRIKDWFTKIWAAFRRLLSGEKLSVADRLVEDLQNGRIQVDPEKAFAAGERRAKFVTTQREAQVATELAKGGPAKKIEGEEFLAQVDGPVKLMEKHGVQNLPASIRRAFGYTEAKGIQTIGETNNGGPEDYYAIRNRSQNWEQGHLGAMANLHAVRFMRTLQEVMEDGRAAVVELNSPGVQEKIRRLQGAFVSALFAEQAFNSAQVAIQTALAQAYELLKADKKTDLKTAQIEAEIKMLKEVAESRVALERLLDDMTRTLLSSAAGRTALNHGGTSQEFESIFRDLKRSTGQTITSDQLIGVAAYLLSRMPELRNQLLAAQYAKQAGPLAAARARLKPLLDALAKDPAATLERMMRTRENRAADLSAAEFLFFHLQQEVTRELDGLYTRMKAGQVARDITSDAATQRYVADVSAHGKSYNGKPFEPFVQTEDTPGGEFIDPIDGRIDGFGTDLMTANATLVRQRYNQGTRSIKNLEDWLAGANPDHPDYERNRLNLETLRNYWGNVAMLTPNHRDDPMPFTLSILNRTVDLAGGRLAPQVKTALSALNRMSHFAKAWNSKASVNFERDWKAALRSHRTWNNLTGNDLRKASLAYDLHFQELANLNQYRHGGVKLGDKTMTGRTVTKEDMALLRTQVTLGEQALETVQRVDRQVTEDARGLPEGMVVYRKAVAVSEHTLPRLANRDRVEGLQPIRAAHKAHTANATPQTLAALAAALETTWPTDGNAWLRQRNADFARPTIFDGAGGALEAISSEIQNGMQYPTFASAVRRIAQLTGETEASVGDALGREFGRIVAHFVTTIEGQTDPHTTVKVTGDDPTNSFTAARGEQLGPWTFYKTGWSNSDDVRGHAAQMVSVTRHRVEQGLRAQLADLKRAQNEFKQRQRELESAGEKNPKAAALAENRAGRRSGEAFDEWFMFEHRIGGLENRIKEIDDARTPTRNEFSRVIGRYVSGATRVLIGSFPTTFRNTGAIYPFRTIYAMGSNSWRTFLGGLGIGAVQQVKMLGTWAFSVLKSALWTPLKGIYMGLRATARGQGMSQLWKQVVRAFVEEYATTGLLRIKEVKEMADAGVYPMADAVGEYDNAVADALYHGIPRQDLSSVAKVALAPLAALEVTMLAVISAGNPTLGDAVTNSTLWKFLNSSFGPNVEFARKGRALLKRIQSGTYPRTFDLKNPSAAQNALDPDDIGLSANQLSQRRKTFLESGVGSFDAKVIDYLNRLQSDPQAVFMSKEDLVTYANWGIDQYNRANASNQPGVLRGTNPIIEATRPLQNWPTRALASFLEFLSVPTKVGKAGDSELKLKMLKMGQWLGKAASGLLVGTLVAGAASELSQEAVLRAYKKVFFQQEANNRWPWEHETVSKKVQAYERYGLQTVPLLSIPINQVMPQNSPARASFDPSFVMIEKAKDILAWVSYGQQTGNWWYKTPATVTGFYQDAKAMTARMPSQSGLNAKRNAEALAKHYGPEDLTARTFRGLGAPANLTELSPFGPELWNAAYNGNVAEVKQIADRAMATARRLRKPDPRNAVEQLFYNGNFMRNALSQLPSEAQYKSMYAKMSAEQRATMKKAEVNYMRAAARLGFPTPTFYQPTEKIEATALRRAQGQTPIGTPRGLSRYQ